MIYRKEVASVAEKRVSNYEKQCAEWTERFRSVDMQAVLRRLPEIRDEGDAYTVRYFGKDLSMRRPGMEIVWADGAGASFCDKMNYYTLMWYCRDGAKLTGQWLPFGSLRGAGPFDPAYQKTILRPFADTFSGRPELLARACEALGGKKLPVSDAGYELDSFACLPLRVLFWDGDDEFPANANILFDASAPDFIHVESVVTIASQCVVHLAQTAGVKIASPTF